MDFLALSCYVSIRSQFHVVISLGFIREKRCSVRLYLQLFVGELMSYSRYLCLFAYSGVQRILCSGFFFGGGFVLCILCCQFLWIVHILLPLRHSLKFI